MEWNGTERNGTERNGTERNEVEFDGLEYRERTSGEKWLREGQQNTMSERKDIDTEIHGI